MGGEPRCDCILRPAGVGSLPAAGPAGTHHRAGQLHGGGEPLMRLSDFSILCCGVLLNALAQLGLKAATDATGPLIVADGAILRRSLELLAVPWLWAALACRSEEHTSELQSHVNLVCRLLLEKKKNKYHT